MATDTHFWKFDYGYEAVNFNDIPLIVPGKPELGETIKKEGQLTNRDFSVTVKPEGSLTGDAVGLVDVTRDFPWTAHDFKFRDKVPSIRLKEKRLTVSAFLTNMFNGLLNAYDGVQGAAATVIGVDKTAVKKPQKAELDGEAEGLSKYIADMADKLSTEKFKQDMTFDALQSSYVSTYNGLYLLKPTKFVYRLPLNVDEAISQSNKFGPTGSSTTDVSTPKGEKSSPDNAITFAGKVLKNFGEMAGNAYGVVQPGVYFEKSQIFNMESDGPSFESRFVLSNTGGYSAADSLDIITRNYNLIFLLMYQNTPGRRTRSVIDPPCIYEVFVDGGNYIPYAYISRLEVKHLGRTVMRTLPFPHVHSNGDPIRSVNVMVPEAYEVSILISSLTPKSRNFAMAAMDSKNNFNTSSTLSMGNTVRGNTVIDPKR